MGQNKSSHRAVPSTEIAVDSSRGVHLFEVANYSQHRNLGVRSFIRSSTFHVGGCAWSVRFYPGGSHTQAENEGYVAVGVELMTQDAVVSASHGMGLIDRATGARYSRVEASKIAFDTRSSAEGFVQCMCLYRFMRKSELEASPYLRDDRLVIECTLRVIKGTRLVSQVMPPVEPEIVMPPSDLPDHLGSLLKEGMGADVTFDVQGKSFPAHRILLAARSPVFKAELLGPMKEGSADRIAVHEIRPAVFAALLHFVYTDALPSMDDKDGGTNLIGDLLVAADRYAMDRLKLVCERTLSRSLTVDNVSTILVLANRHNCCGLKDACVEFVNSDRMDVVTRTKGYAGVKNDHPYVLIDLFEKAVRLGKILSRSQ